MGGADVPRSSLPANVIHSNQSSFPSTIFRMRAPFVPCDKPCGSPGQTGSCTRRRAERQCARLERRISSRRRWWSRDGSRRIARCCDQPDRGPMSAATAPRRTVSEGLTSTIPRFPAFALERRPSKRWETETLRGRQESVTSEAARERAPADVSGSGVRILPPLFVPDSQAAALSHRPGAPQREPAQHAQQLPSRVGPQLPPRRRHGLA